MTNIQMSANKSWLVRYFLQSPRFSQSNQHDMNHARSPILLPWELSRHYVTDLATYTPIAIPIALHSFPSPPSPRPESRPQDT